MAFRRSRRTDEIDPFSDVLFNALLGFVFFFVIAMMSMNIKAKTGDIPSKAEYIITVSWPDMNPNDLDAWVQDPAGNIVWFRQREAGLMHLDRDDRGLDNDTIMVNGQRIVNPLNQEVVTLRGIAPGEYTVNVHYYESKDRLPVDAQVSVVKVNPKAEVIFYGVVNLPQKGAERTAVRFTLAADGAVADVNTLQKTLVTEQK